MLTLPPPPAATNVTPTKSTGGRPFAGGRAIETTIWNAGTPNITPDPNTGIGRWRLADLTWAMRWGVAPDTSHYLPAFPFPYYNRLSVRDLEDLEAFLDSLPAVSQLNRAGDRAPFAAVRGAVVVLASQFSGPWRPYPSKDALWNRGAYLVATVGRCGDCHTPRNWLGGSRSRSRSGRRFGKPRWPCRSEHHPGPGNRDRSVERRRYRHLADRRSKAGLRFCRRRHGRNREKYRPPQRHRPASDRRLPQIRRQSARQRKTERRSVSTLDARSRLLMMAGVPRGRSGGQAPGSPPERGRNADRACRGRSSAVRLAAG